MSDLQIVMCVAFDHRSDAQGLERFKQCILHCDSVDVAMEVSGTFDMIVQVSVASLATYNDEMERIRPQLAQFVRRIETNFVCKKVERQPTVEKCMWVPCVGGRKRIDIGMIDKVVAEGDYMRLFIGDWDCLVYSTVHALKEQLDARHIQLHRSSIVRIDFIDRLLHQERRWIACLRDGSRQAVAKSHVPDVLDLLARQSTKVQHIRPRFGKLAEVPSQMNEIHMQVMR